MKKLLLIITLIFTTASFAQIEKASDGTLLEFSFMPNLQGTTMFATDSGILNGYEGMFTYRNLDNGTRWRAQFVFDAEDGFEDYMMLAAFYGKEKHHAGSDRLDTYTGWEAGGFYEDFGGDSEEGFVGGVFAGANYYIANNLYIGLEARYMVMLADGRTTVGLFSSGVNGMLTVGFKL
jgi:hypothetical protein|tara:strand:+ start:183 stop:716 length:534 start_codon:yes stop_codon:yes gene_type:complete